jgi:hypothetical protein
MPLIRVEKLLVNQEQRNVRIISQILQELSRKEQRKNIEAGINNKMKPRSRCNEQNRDVIQKIGRRAKRG